MKSALKSAWKNLVSNLSMPVRKQGCHYLFGFLASEHEISKVASNTFINNFLTAITVIRRIEILNM